ncbi:hypothetical protein [Aureibacillus halotolerans]|uniref:Uncharacterized protein n=1 Tax=Aureibacillus halotolerans TaxID=1508390 RepID=A0A4R6UDF7_9BACI|nr:hypothetical protein [Aureibacillus halotolerans]TDQ41134.1 hypothetical protein EV213_104132 [Aureibacillus halotolerans]
MSIRIHPSFIFHCFFIFVLSAIFSVLNMGIPLFKGGAPPLSALLVSSLSLVIWGLYGFFCALKRDTSIWYPIMFWLGGGLLFYASASLEWIIVGLMTVLVWVQPSYGVTYFMASNHPLLEPSAHFLVPLFVSLVGFGMGHYWRKLSMHVSDG